MTAILPSTASCERLLKRVICSVAHNPKGIESFSPGLARQRLPWDAHPICRTTLKGLHQFADRLQPLQG